MITPESGTDNTAWPLPKFNFEVDLGNGLNSLIFQEVTGLQTETQVMEYRKSNSPLFKAEEMPALVKVGNVTLKKGIFPDDDNLWNWFNAIKMNTAQRSTMLIKLLDENGNAAMQWQLNNAFPTKLTGTDLKSEGNEVAVESVEIAFETMVING